MRIADPDRFREVLETGHVAVDRQLVVAGLPNALSYSRIGAAIPKRTGSAALRNRWKRWMREAFRQHRESLPSGYDFVIRPRRGATGSFAQVCDSMVALTRRIAAKH
jgi:ribonuclease P protein component